MTIFLFEWVVLAKTKSKTNTENLFTYVEYKVKDDAPDYCNMFVWG